VISKKFTERCTVIRADYDEPPWPQSTMVRCPYGTREYQPQGRLIRRRLSE
jgi:hypothetical protein